MSVRAWLWWLTAACWWGELDLSLQLNIIKQPKALQSLTLCVHCPQGSSNRPSNHYKLNKAGVLLWNVPESCVIWERGAGRPADSDKHSSDLLPMQGQSLTQHRKSSAETYSLLLMDIIRISCCIPLYISKISSLCYQVSFLSGLDKTIIVNLLCCNYFQSYGRLFYQKQPKFYI